MAPRAIWKGQLRLSLVSIPVEIYSATKTGAKVSFRQIHAPSGKPVRYEKTVPGVGPVDSDDIVKGVETGEGEYLLLKPEEIDEIRLETKKTLELVQFVEASEIPPLYYDKPYYLVVSEDTGEEAYRVLRDALRETGRVGLGQLAMRGKEYLAAVRPCGDGLLMETLHYASEIRDAEPMFRDVSDDTADKELLDVATSLIEKKSKPFDAAAYTDSYSEALAELIDAKRKDRKAPRASSSGRDRGGENVVDLMSALKQSLDEGKGRSRAKSKSTKSRKKAS